MTAELISSSVETSRRTQALDLHRSGLDFAEISERLGVTQEWARQLCRTATSTEVADVALPSPAGVLAAADDDFASLDPTLKVKLCGLIDDGVPENTRRAYEGVFARFDAWCAANGQCSSPASPAAVVGYLTHLTMRPEGVVQPSTLQHVAWTISARQKAHGYGPLAPDVLLAVSRMAKGHAVQLGALARSKAYPLVPEEIRDIVQGLHATWQRGEISEFVWLRAALMLVLGYSVAARESEACAWRIGDITHTTTGLDVYFWKSKTDKKAEGVHRPIPRGHNVLTDPVTRLDEYVAYLDSRGIDVNDPMQPLLRSITKKGEPRPGGGPLSVRNVDDIYRNACRIGGHLRCEDVSGHSLRSGFASASAFGRIPMAIWARHGRWSPLSPVAADYVQAVELVLDNPLNTVGL